VYNRRASVFANPATKVNDARRSVHKAILESTAYNAASVRTMASAVTCQRGTACTTARPGFTDLAVIKV
jgi:hypothetical protein